MATASVASQAASSGEGDWVRPTQPLTGVQLFQISIFWFALNTIWGGFEVYQQERVDALVADWPQTIGPIEIQNWTPSALGIMELLAMVIAVLTMPIAGSISDYTTTRYGRRKPFVLVGAVLTLVALGGVALAGTYLVLVVFFALLQFTSNLARGPFAGLVPDLVPERQVGLASGLMGLMLTFGLAAGFLVLWTGLATQDFTAQMLLIGGFVALTGIGTFLWVPNGPAGKPRDGRGWSMIARETFGADILRERSYVFLLGSRFLILMATGFFFNFSLEYLEEVLDIRGEERIALGPLDLSDKEFWVLAALAVSIIATAIGTLPGARISDQVGRKPVIYVSTVFGAIGIAIIALAQEPSIILAGVAFVGLGGGIFLSVDWALLTDIVPKASAGRYMGMSNIVEATNGPLGTAIAGFIWTIAALFVGDAGGGRTAILVGVLLFIGGALLLRPVVEPPRGRGRGSPVAAEAEAG
jgi:MFS family permease